MLLSVLSMASAFSFCDSATNHLTSSTYVGTIVAAQVITTAAMLEGITAETKMGTTATVESVIATSDVIPSTTYVLHVERVLFFMLFFWKVAFLLDNNKCTTLNKNRLDYSSSISFESYNESFTI